MIQVIVYMYERSNEQYSIHVNQVAVISGMDFEMDDNTLVSCSLKRISTINRRSILAFYSRIL